MRAVVQGLWGEVEDRTVEVIVVAVGVLAIGIRTHFSWKKIVEGQWEAIAISVSVLSVLVIWHAFRAAHAVSTEIAGERPVHGFHVQIITVSYPRLRLYSIAFLLTAIVVSLSGFVWKISIEKQSPSTSIGTTEKPPTTPAKKSVIHLDLALITTIHRIKDPDTKGYMKGGQNDLVAVLRVKQRNGVSVRHIQKLQIVGDVSADCNSYVAAFYPDLHGEHTIEELDDECNKKKPFFNLSLVSFPIGQARIDPNDEDLFDS